MTQTASILAMLANCHRLGFERFDSQGKPHPGWHARVWEVDEFLPAEFRSREGKQRNVIQGSIECLKVFCPGATTVEVPRSSFTVVDEEQGARN